MAEGDGDVGAALPSPEAPPPATADLLALSADDWAALLPHLRAALHAVPDADADRTVRRLRSTPPVKLAGGRVRTDACRLVAAGGPLWAELRSLLDDADLPDGLAWLVHGGRPSAVPPAVDDRPDTARAGLEARLEAALEDAARVRERAAVLREERDEARRQRTGAEARATAAERAATEHREALAALEAEVARLRTALDDAAEERERVVERERRRSASTVDGLREELRAARRALEEAEQRAKGAAAAAAAARAALPAAGGGERRAARADEDRFLDGRPSRLPAGVHPDTREAAELLLHPGRRVLVDGYNVTLAASERRGGGLSLAEQRAWLVNGLAALAARLRVEPVVWFDTAAAGPPGGERARGVSVRFTHPGVTADDEIVLEVAASPPDEPLLVVTDDRELRDRLREHRVDLLRGSVLVPLLG